MIDKKKFKWTYYSLNINYNDCILHYSLHKTDLTLV